MKANTNVNSNTEADTDGIWTEYINYVTLNPYHAE